MAISSNCPENVVLVGFMGSGKSTVGRVLAKRSGRFFLDADALIESLQGKEIPVIFEERGEEYFRELERECAEWMAECVRGSVISTGGGMPLVAARLRDIGRVVYLSLPFEAILKRIPENERLKRPLFKDLQRARGLYKKRQRIYENLADFRVDATKKQE
ncbi:MAG: shikimate kinase, partial [Hydrogenimonas sp.]|nr:shikimate kinase [Hydrogenimonas sp.]